MSKVVMDRLATGTGDGSAAFPSSFRTPDGTEHIYTGMSLRDWFAGQMLEGMIANPEFLQAVTASGGVEHESRDKVARRAYEYADAMLKERE